MQAQREALANLMSQVPSAESSHGRGRHRHSRTKEAWQGYEDSTACEWFLCSDFCIFDLFYSTRESLGCCTRKHLAPVKESYIRARRRQRETDLRLDRYESGCLRRLQTMLRERDALIEVKRAQAEDASEEAQNAAAAEEETPEAKESASRMDLLSQEAQSKTQEAEKLGSKGHVREAEAALAEASRMKAERDVLMMLQAKAAAIRGNLRHQRMLSSGLRRPCEVCGSMLPLDVDCDVTKGHNIGRIHQAWVKLRDEYARLLRRAQEAEAAGFSPPRGVLSAAALRGFGRLDSAKAEIQLAASTQGATRRMTAALAWRALQEEDRRAGGTDSRALLLDAHRSPRGDRRAERRCKGRSRSRSKNSGDRRRRRDGSREDGKRSRKAKSQSPILTHQKRGELEEGEHGLEEGEL